MNLDQLYLENKAERRRIARDELNRKLLAIRKRATVVEQEVVADFDFDIFPECAYERFQTNDIWEQVLPFLIDPEDVKNAYFTCPTFEPHLHEKKLTDLLLKAFTILVDKQFNRPVYYDNYECCDRRLHLKNYPVRDALILTFRLVSKHAKRAVESNFFERPFTSKDWHLNDEVFSSDNCRVLRPCALRAPHEAKNALSALGENDSGHCFIRHLHVHYCDYDQKNDLLKFLEKHGHAVWGISYFSNKGCMKQNYEKIREIVCRTQNLKALSLSLKCNVSPNFDHDLNLYEFPSIPSLKYFCLYSDPDLMEYFDQLRFVQQGKMIRGILKTNNHIKTLLLRRLKDGYKFADSFLSPFTTLQEESRLEELELERFEAHFYSTSVLRQAGWPLRVLHLYLDESLDTRSFQGNELIPTLNRFGNTLKELRLDHDIRKDESSPKLDLPQLKNLTLYRDIEDENGRLWFDWDYRGDHVSCISLGDFVGLKSIEELKFWRPTHYVQNYFKVFPQLKQMQNGWKDGERKVYKRGKLFLQK